MSRPNRRISNRYLRHLLQAIEEEMGRQSLRMVLKNAGIARYMGAFPPLDSNADSFASDLSAIQTAISTYYGRGARASLNRVGRATWRQMLAEAPYWTRTRLRLARFSSHPARSSAVLQTIIAEVKPPNGNLSIEKADPELVFVDGSSDFTYGQTAEEAICWVMQGMVQEALCWIWDRDIEVSELACMAMGAPACRFNLHL